jgi:hypothetical protein
MIHHISISARNPDNVAKVLGELFNGRVYPFPPAWCRDAYQVVSGDEHGTVIEVYGGEYHLEPVRDIFRKGEMAEFHPFHALISIPADGAEIERIAQREGWPIEFTPVGTPGLKPAFHCYRVWIEGRTLFELVPQSMIAEYETYMQFANLDELRPKEVAAAA